MKVMLLIRGAGRGARSRVQELDHNGCTIGREEADVALDDRFVSKKHAVLYEDDTGELRVKDLGSTNGTLLNREKIRDSPLEIGNEISVGDSVLVVLEIDRTPTENRLRSIEVLRGWPALFLADPQEKGSDDDE